MTRDWVQEIKDLGLGSREQGIEQSFTKLSTLDSSLVKLVFFKTVKSI